MGKPSEGNASLMKFEYIGLHGEPREVKHLSTGRKRKQLVIPQVVASERGTAQTNALVRWGCGIPIWDLER
jgi:hypothetical protein